VIKMTADEKRIDQRVQSANLLSYTCLDENDHEMMQGMGRTLNVSEGGILLETHVTIRPEYIVSLTMAIEDEIMDFKGKIAHTKKRADGKFESGIEFIEMDEGKQKFFKQYIVMFGRQQNITQREEFD